MTDKSNGKGSRPRYNASDEFRINYDDIFAKHPMEDFMEEQIKKSILMHRQRQAWETKHSDTHTWEEFQKFEECPDCGFWSDETCNCYTRR